MSITITKISSADRRYKLAPGEGADAVHRDPMYSYATTILHTDSKHVGTGLAFTLGGGNELVCSAIDQLAGVLVGREIEELMADFGTVQTKDCGPSFVSLAWAAQGCGTF